jgi:CYTH domain-containing protein
MDLGAQLGDRFHPHPFAGHLAGLVLAEVELTAVDQEFLRPDWVGAEVTGDARYQNSVLARALAPPAA